MSLKTANSIFIAALLIGAVVSGIGSNGGPQWLTFLGLAMMCGGLMIKVRFFRCPHCGQFLGRKSGDACPWCGEKLN